MKDGKTIITALVQFGSVILATVMSLQTTIKIADTFMDLESYKPDDDLNLSENKF